VGAEAQLVASPIDGLMLDASAAEICS